MGWRAGGVATGDGLDGKGMGGDAADSVMWSHFIDAEGLARPLTAGPVPELVRPLRAARTLTAFAAGVESAMGAEGRAARQEELGKTLAAHIEAMGMRPSAMVSLAAASGVAAGAAAGAGGLESKAGRELATVRSLLSEFFNDQIRAVYEAASQCESTLALIRSYPEGAPPEQVAYEARMANELELALGELDRAKSVLAQCRDEQLAALAEDNGGAQEARQDGPGEGGLDDAGKEPGLDAGTFLLSARQQASRVLVWLAGVV
ncbi:uncharacterized protein AMSG_08751 [Thecamonas trahens ATCC 50062]|uniref:Uncharacterized protein n=1 Tax=Thecamonas trahens ATCC 50062 TaxID=461836 RepID=A0A0L0DLS8_THETB|nr:hypothetical protein AMSG_08751 [Thecamonas trahens ATCC 50062]KNC53262.1 hypothetical protein AMSG_08751 [Thecamonas trahens ATCC 50062]|eukprot:XP_013754526.1 hypothetical protein AMSG_08751 [Thecamonas trahens ATCC 50062]